MKTKRSFLAIALALVFLAGCAGGDKFGMSDLEITAPQLKVMAELAGYNAAYWPLKNNPAYIPDVEVAVRKALDIAYTPGHVDVAQLVEDIVWFATRFKKAEGIQEYVPVISQALSQFQETVTLDLDIPENYDVALDCVRAFLEGAQTAVYDLK